MGDIDVKSSRQISRQQAANYSRLKVTAKMQFIPREIREFNYNY